MSVYLSAWYQRLTHVPCSKPLISLKSPFISKTSSFSLHHLENERKFVYISSVSVNNAHKHTMASRSKSGNGEFLFFFLIWCLRFEIWWYRSWKFKLMFFVTCSIIQAMKQECYEMENAHITHFCHHRMTFIYLNACISYIVLCFVITEHKQAFLQDVPYRTPSVCVQPHI